MDAEEKKCPVCQDKLQEPTQLLECNHEFCQSCLQQSIHYRKHCPVCRKPVNGDQPTAVPAVSNQTRRSRVRYGRSRDPVISPIIASPFGPSVFAGIWRQRSAPPHQFGSSNPSFASLYAPHVLRPPQPPVFPSTVAQSTGPAGLPLIRPFRNYTIPQVDVYGHGDFSVFNDENEQMGSLLFEQAWAEQRGPLLNNRVRVFACPYCQQGGMDELDLRDHCNTHHQNNPTPVVCPVCMAQPHGDENYYSRNFIGHLNLRHSYYSEDITNTHQSDAMNMQAAILESFQLNSDAAQ
ncbi:E3 ubiquitin-protein ligase RNF138 [Alosa pseudoharengus]|uniref:E3 ubiquitin-protein ligase RNF138 n=1 Tax=Alosa pseudoharengus TaxID=34774 RepID=UPI003F8B4A6F